MKIYYFIPIVLGFASYRYFWKTSYEEKIDLKANNLIDAQTKAEERFNHDRMVNTSIYPAQIPKPSALQKDKLKAEYPTEIKLLVIDNQQVFTKNDSEDWIERQYNR